MFIFILAYGVDPTWTWLLIPVIVLALLIVTVAVSMIVSALYPRFRDVAADLDRVLDDPLLRTPVLYPIGVAPERFRHIVQLNPLTPIFEQAQKWVIDPNAPGALGATKGSEWLLVVSFAVLRRALRGGVLDLQARGAENRRGALSASNPEEPRRRRRGRSTW